MGKWSISICELLPRSLYTDFFVKVDKSGKDCRKNGGTQLLGSHDNIYAPGGQGLYMDPKVGPVMFYHYVDTKIGYADGQKKLGINKLDFSSGWPVVL
jgi:arabinan endo-1,5-alpha-L-arabinosidase